MGKISPKFRTKLRWIALFLIFFIVAASIGLNAFLSTRKSSLLQLSSGPLTYQANAAQLLYIFPNTIFIQDLTLKPSKSTDEENIISIPLVAIQFSLLDIILKRPISFPTIVLNKLTCTQSGLARFLNENIQNIAALLKNLPESDALILIKEAQVHPSPDDPAINSLITNFSFNIKNRKFSGHGHIFHILNNHPFFISFSGERLTNGLRITKLNLDKSNLSSSFWGETKGNDLLLQGYAFYSDRSKDLIPPRIRIPFISRSRRITDPTLEIVDIQTRIRMEFPKFQIQQLSFNLNSFPVALRGIVALSSQPAINLTASVLNAPRGQNHINNLDRVNISILGALEDGTFNAQSAMDLIFEKSTDANFPLDKINISFPKTSMYFDQHRRFTTKFDQSSILITTLKGQHKISFDELKVLGNLKDEKYEIFELTALMYKGGFHGRVWCDTRQLPWSISANAAYSDIDARSLQELLETFSKINGQLSGKLNVKSHPAFNLNGDFLIKDGSLHNFDFFKWMANTFGMPSLVNVPFTETTGKYWLNALGNGLTDINVTSVDVGLGGHFNIDKNNLVNSKLSLSLSRRTLQESPKFRAILKMFDQEVPELTFDFQLSGNQEAMNFQWLQSDFKERIQSRIPNFVERMIDRKIDAILEGNIPGEPSSSP